MILNPATERIDYGEKLMPRDGYKVEFAVGTTYSLELETMLMVPLALFHAKYLTEATKEDNLRCDMLDALQQVKDKVVVFVHANNIKVGKDHSMLFNYLDQSICNIEMPENSNFHPKMWLMKYVRVNDPQDYEYRLVVTSRNLSASTDFDLEVSIDGYRAEEETDNGALIDFMQYLLGNRSDKEKDILKTIKRDLRNTKFDKPDNFNEIGFYPHSIDNHDCPIQKFEEWDDCLVVSPFIDEGALKEIKRKTIGECILVSRETELDKIDRAILRQFKNVYCFSPALENCSEMEDNDEVEENDRLHQNVSLHAKLYVISGRAEGDRRKKNHWYVGSTNGTTAAFERNIECLLRMTSTSEDTSISKLVESFTEGKAPLFEAYNINTPLIGIDQAETNKELIIRKVKTLLARLKVQLQAIQKANGLYEIEAKCGDLTELDRINGIASVSLTLFSGDTDSWNLQKETSHLFDKQISCQHLSPFMEVMLTVQGESIGSFLMLSDFEMSAEREGKMLSELLDTEEKVMKYLMFFLDERTDVDMLGIGKEIGKKNTNGRNLGTGNREYENPIYEKLLYAASRNPESIERMSESIKKLAKQKGSDGQPILKKEFLDFWKNFELS
ncbi:MAG: phospholipase D family protein [Paludibacteraceae bacterium]|nr:phospholipase D family protein [Paludibacteraceae bacterium]